VEGAESGDPVPGEHAFAADDESIAIGREGMEEGIGLGGEVLVEKDGAGVVADAEVHRSRMEIDAAVESVGLDVETHDHCLSSDGAGLEPASWLKRPLASENPTIGPRPTAASPYNPWDEPGPSQGRQ